MGRTDYATRYYKHKIEQSRNKIVSGLDLRTIELARNDAGHFGEFVCGKIPCSHHREWIAAITGRSNHLLKDIAGDNLNILAPRGSAKSTWIAIIIAWAIGKNPGIQIIYESYSESVAASRSRIIKRIIESPEYRIIFPNIRKSSKWSDLVWEIDKSYAGVMDFSSDYTFFATGISGSIVSRRSHLIVLDDLIKSSQSIKNRDIREQVITNFNETVLPTLVPGGRCISIGTRFRKDDIHASEFTEAKGWKVISQKAIVVDPKTGREKSYWEERFSLEELCLIRENNPYIFFYQFQNTITESGFEAISYDWIFRGDIPFEFDRLVAGCDLASSLKTRADFTCFVLGGKKDDKYYIIDARFGKWNGNLDKFKVVQSLRDDWRGFDLLFEKVSYQTSFRGDFDVWANESGLNDVYCRGIYIPGDKYEKLSGFKGLFQRGKIIFNRYRDMGRLIDEICNLGDEEHDDGADAFTLCMAGLTGRRRLDVGDVD